MPAPHPGVMGQRRVKRLCRLQGRCQRHGIKKCHVRHLAQLRAGAVRGIADNGQAGTMRLRQCAVAIARDGQVRGKAQPVDKRCHLWPKSGHFCLPKGHVGQGPCVQCIGRHGPEQRRPGGRVIGQPANGQHTRHPPRPVIALGKLVLRQAACRWPPDMAPDRAIGQGTRLQWRQPRMAARGVNHQIEGPEAAAIGKVYAPLAPHDRRRLHICPQRDGHPARRLHRLPQHMKKACPVQRQPRRIGAVGHIQHRRAPILPPHPPQGRAQRAGGFSGPNRIKNGKPDRLDHQPRAKRSWALKTLEKLHVMALTRQQPRYCKPAHARPQDTDRQPFRHHAITQP